MYKISTNHKLWNNNCDCPRCSGCPVRAPINNKPIKLLSRRFKGYRRIDGDNKNLGRTRGIFFYYSSGTRQFMYFICNSRGELCTTVQVCRLINFYFFNFARHFGKGGRARSEPQTPLNIG